MKNDKKMLDEVNQMKNLMRYMDGEKVNTKQIKENIINEEPSNQYSRKVDVSVSVYGSKLYILTDNGVDEAYIEEVYTDPVYLTYNIDIDMREWGIKDISLYNITGPNEINATLSYYMEGEDDPREKDITLKLNWEKLTTDRQSNSGLITVGNELEIWLENSETTDLVVKEMSIETYELGSDD